MNIFYLRVTIISILLILLQLHAALAVQTHEPPSEFTAHNIDIRPVYNYVNTTERDGSRITDHSFNLRARYGISYHILSNLTFRGRPALADFFKLCPQYYHGRDAIPLYYRLPATGLPGMKWESCVTMNDTWGYKHFDHNWKSEEILIHNLIDNVSKGGNFLLNVEPGADRSTVTVTSSDGGISLQLPETAPDSIATVIAIEI